MQINFPEFPILSEQEAKTLVSGKQITKLLKDIFICKGTFCSKHLQRTELWAVQCICIRFIPGYII